MQPVTCSAASLSLIAGQLYICGRRLIQIISLFSLPESRFSIISTHTLFASRLSGPQYPPYFVFISSFQSFIDISSTLTCIPFHEHLRRTPSAIMHLFSLAALPACSLFSHTVIASHGAQHGLFHQHRDIDTPAVDPTPPSDFNTSQLLIRDLGVGMCDENTPCVLVPT